MAQILETYVNWLHQLSNVLGKELVMNEDASCAVEFKDNITLEMAVNPETRGFYMYSVICPFPENPAVQLQMMHHLLRLNLEQAETLQGSFCLSEDNRSVLLTFGRPVDSYDANRFVHTFLHFFDICEGTKTVLGTIGMA
ncbi:type III secretion system chaperone [Desulfospira joergensenii]|uniref:type III secretion system chaperone n=1 Tax=Desulfospira joergensenii TaxID=53329 RepID=UPI0003B71C0C|nr:type III secretion system chaperone [Desulfospira joergensenii]